VGGTRELACIGHSSKLHYRAASNRLADTKSPRSMSEANAVMHHAPKHTTDLEICKTPPLVGRPHSPNPSRRCVLHDFLPTAICGCGPMITKSPCMGPSHRDSKSAQRDSFKIVSAVLLAVCEEMIKSYAKRISHCRKHEPSRALGDSAHLGAMRDWDLAHHPLAARGSFSTSFLGFSCYDWLLPTLTLPELAQSVHHCAHSLK